MYSHISGSRFKTEEGVGANTQDDQKSPKADYAAAPLHLPVVVAVPQPVNFPEPVRASVSVVRSPSDVRFSAPPYVPFKWAHGARGAVSAAGSPDKTRAEVFVDHAARASKAHEVGAPTSCTAGMRACFQHSNVRSCAGCRGCAETHC